MSNLDIKNNNNSNNNPNTYINSNINNIMNNYNSNNTNKNYNTKIFFNQKGIGSNKNIIGFNLPQNQPEKNSKKEEYENLAKLRQNLLDLMNQIQFKKIMINNNNDNNNNDNQKEEFKNNQNKDTIEPEREKTTILYLLMQIQTKKNLMIDYLIPRHLNQKKFKE